MLHLQRVPAPMFVAALCASAFMLAGTVTAHAATIVTPLSGAHVNDRTPTVTFTGAAVSSPVDLKIGNIVVGSGVSDSSGDGSITPLAPVTATSRANVTFTVDDGGLTPDSVAVTVDQRPTLSGINTASPHDWRDVHFDVAAAIPGNDVLLYEGATLVGGGTADSSGEVENMSLYSEPTSGPHHYTAVTIGDDSAESSPSDGVVFTVVPAPAEPEFAQLVDYIQLNQTQPAIQLTGVDPTASKVTLYHVVEVGGVGTVVALASTTTVNPNGTATITPTLADGLHSLLVKQTVGGVETFDPNGGGSTVSVYVRAAAPTLSSNDDGKLTNEVPYFDVTGALQSLGGNGDNTNTVELYIDGSLAGSDDTDGGGAAGIHPVSVADGAHTAYAVTRDDLGHLSTARSNEVTFTLDTTAPAAPTLASPQNGATVTTSRPQVVLNAEAGAAVHLLVDDTQDEGWLTADGNGNATFTLGTALADGVHTLYLYAEDAAGNGSEYGIVTVTVKTAVATPPTPPVVTPPVAPVTPKNPTDLDGDGINNNWLVGGKPAAAPATPKASVSGGKVKLTLKTAPKGAKSVRVYRADGKGGYDLVKTLTAKSKTFTDAKVKAGHSYKYKTVAVNAKGQQGKASGAVTAKVKKK